MKPWRILSKTVVRVDRDSIELHLQVERDGKTRDAIVSGATFEEKNVGDEVELNEAGR